MSFNIHSASAPVFVALLNNLSGWLDKAEALATEKKFDIENLLTSRLAPDMIPLRGQIHMTTAWAKNCQCRLAGQTPPDFPDTDVTLAQLRARIARTIDIVQTISAKDLEGAETRTVTYKLGPDITMNQNGAEYFLRMALPNFYFHLTTAYDILRHNGVPIGKQDFLAGMFAFPGK